MNRTVVWSNAARDDYLGIIRFIAQANPDAAERVADTIDRVVANLGAMATGRPGRVTGTYEKVVPGLPTIVAYEVSDQPEAAGSRFSMSSMARAIGPMKAGRVGRCSLRPREREKVSRRSRDG